MKFIKGTAKNVDTFTQITGQATQHHITSRFISTFIIDNQQVKLMSKEPVLVSNGDIVAVAGSINQGVLKGYAYKNETTGVIGNIGLLSTLFGGVAFPSFGLFVYANFNDPFFGIVPMIFAAAGSCFGAFLFYKAAQTLRAMNLLQNQA